MSTSPLLSIFVVITFVGALRASAQPPAMPQAVALEASVRDGWMSGVVIDEAGMAVRGANILASGTVVAAATTDSRGRFTLVLPIGDYLVRATRIGFLSTYREPIRVQPNRGIERRIRLIRNVSAPAEAIEPQAAPAPAAPSVEELHGHSEMAWRLRHLKRTVLREVAPNVFVGQKPAPEPPASGLLDLSGHVNLLTASPLRTIDVGEPAGWSQSVANIFLGAPVGQSGDWSVRAAMASGAASSWALRGEYGSRRARRHDVRLAVSYSRRGLSPSVESSGLPSVFDARRAGSLEATDGWSIRPSVTLNYGLRVDHYDYLPESALVSPHAGLAIEMRPGTRLLLSASRPVAAPGGNDFRAPSSTGLWLPAVHTYALAPDETLDLQRARRYAIGVEQALDPAGGATISVHWLSEQTDNQMATIFGLDGEGGRYDLVTVGDVSLAGWRIALEGQLARHVSGRVEYTEARARWHGGADALSLARIDPSILRQGRESVSDLRATMNVTVPVTSTGLAVVYQVNRFDPAGVPNEIRTLTDNGVELELRQRLPYEPLDAGPLHFLLTLSTMQYETGAPSLYDEALTVRAPARLTAGIQLGF
jgi:hypothetical protein